VDTEEAFWKTWWKDDPIKEFADDCLEQQIEELDKPRKQRKQRP